MPEELGSASHGVKQHQLRLGPLQGEDQPGQPTARAEVQRVPRAGGSGRDPELPIRARLKPSASGDGACETPGVLYVTVDRPRAEVAQPLGLDEST
jgi:hypothetical protein